MDTVPAPLALEVMGSKAINSLLKAVPISNNVLSTIFGSIKIKKVIIRAQKLF